MPIREETFDLATAGTRQLVPSGQRINAVSVTALTAGATFALKLGNNDPFTVDSEGILRIGSDALANDAQQGLIAQNATPQAGASARLVISYTRPGDAGPSREITYGTGN